MATASAALIKALASELFKIYAKPNPLVPKIVDFALSLPELEDALAKFDSEGLFEKILAGATKVTPELRDLILQKISAIQKSAALVPDSVLGKNTLGWFTSKPLACIRPNLEKERDKSSSDASPTGIHAIRYFIENDELPDVDTLSPIQVLQEFRRAIRSWSREIDCIVEQTGNKADANVIVSLEDIADPLTLGIGDIGPPGKFQLRLRLDRFHKWTPSLFKYTVAHEFGHILGVVHEDVTNSGQLMNPRVQDGVTGPMSQDIAAAQHKWGPASA